MFSAGFIVIFVLAVLSIPVGMLQGNHAKRSAYGHWHETSGQIHSQPGAVAVSDSAAYIEAKVSFAKNGEPTTITKLIDYRDAQKGTTPVWVNDEGKVAVPKDFYDSTPIPNPVDSALTWFLFALIAGLITTLVLYLIGRNIQIKAESEHKLHLHLAA